MSKKDKAKLDNWALRSRQVLRFRDYLEENEPDSAKLGLLTKDLLRKATELASLTEAVDDEEDFCQVGLPTTETSLRGSTATLSIGM